MANESTISGVAFGKERTARQMRDRAQWERDQAAKIRAAKRPIGWEHLVQAHENVARAYEQQASKREHEESGAQPKRGHATQKQQPFYGLRIVPSERAGYTPGKYVVQYKDGNGMWFDIGDPKSKAGAEAALKAEKHRVVGSKRSHARKASFAPGESKYAIEYTPRVGHSKGTHAFYSSKQVALKAAKRLANEKNGRVEVAHIDENQDRHFVAEVYPSGW